MLPIIAFLLLSLAQFLTATPIPTNNSSCEPPLKLSPSNWQCYNVDNFLASWWSQHGSSCGNQPFFYCLAAYYNRTYAPCDGIGAICNPGQLEKWKYETESYYIFVAIANVNQYFTNLYKAISSASTFMDQILPDLSNKLDPPHGGTPIWYQELANTLLYVCWLDATWPVAPLLIGSALLADVGIFIAQTVDNQVVNFADFSNELSKLTSKLQDAISHSLNSTFSDYSKFSAFVSNGTFLYGQYGNRNTTEQDFKKTFQSYLTDTLINMILRSKGIFAVVTTKSNVHDKAAPPGQWDSTTHLYWTDPNFKLSNDGSYPVWYLTSYNHLPEDQKKIDKTLFETHFNLTTPEKVFGLSWKCQNETGKLGGGSKSLDLNHPLNQFDLDYCLYSLPVCIKNELKPSNPNLHTYMNCPDDIDPR